MSAMPEGFRQRLRKSLDARNEATQWEELVGALLRRLELSPEEFADARAAYESLGRHLATKLNLPQHDVDVFPQGSMRTQTTISPRGNEKFDLDVVVKLSGPRFINPDPDELFEAFGNALKGHPGAGEPEPKRRCWRLRYPNKPYYFDVTPAVPAVTADIGTALKVRDPDTRWSPSNPIEYAEWFCERADLRFSFQQPLAKGRFEARTNVEPLPQERVGIDDILRRAVQLMKLHRDNMYWGNRDVQPISVIIVTLATNAFERLHRTRQDEFHSPIDVVLAVVEEMPAFIDRSKGYPCVLNPKLARENFADRWRMDGGVREREFNHWHRQLETDIEALLHQSAREVDEDRLRKVFGQAGVDAWKASQPAKPVLSGLISSAEGHTRTGPSAPRPQGSRGTLG